MVSDRALTQTVQELMAGRLMRQPKALLNIAEQAMARKDYAAAAQAARQFTTSIPAPLPIDAFGESYRTALHIMRESAKKNGKLSSELTAGRMALEFDPRDTAALVDYARTLQTANEPLQATKIFEAAFAIRPFSAPIADALKSLYKAANKPEKFAAVHERHLEVIALCVYQNAWLSGNLVYYGAGQTTARDIQLGFPQSTALTQIFNHSTEGAYLVLKGLPHLRLVFEQCELVDPQHGTIPLTIDPQQSLRRIDERTAISASTPGAAYDIPFVIGLPLSVTRAAGATLHLRIRVEPDAELEPWIRRFGTWQHPHIPIASVKED